MDTHRRLSEIIDKGPKERCSITGMILQLDQMVSDGTGGYCLAKVRRANPGESKYVERPGWERSLLK